MIPPENIRKPEVFPDVFRVYQKRSVARNTLNRDSIDMSFVINQMLELTKPLKFLFSGIIALVKLFLLVQLQILLVSAAAQL